MCDFKGSMLLRSKFPRGVFKTEMSCFKPHCISNFPGDELVSGSECHEFSGRFMSSQDFFLGFVKDGELSFEGRKEGLF